MSSSCEVFGRSETGGENMKCQNECGLTPFLMLDGRPGSTAPLPAPAHRLEHADGRIEFVRLGLDQRQFGIQQRALGVELFEIGGVPGLVAIAGMAERARQRGALRGQAVSCSRSRATPARLSSTSRNAVRTVRR